MEEKSYTVDDMMRQIGILNEISTMEQWKDKDGNLMDPDLSSRVIETFKKIAQEIITSQEISGNMIEDICQRLKELNVIKMQMEEMKEDPESETAHSQDIVSEEDIPILRSPVTGKMAQHIVPITQDDKNFAKNVYNLINLNVMRIDKEEDREKMMNSVKYILEIIWASKKIGTIEARKQYKEALKAQINASIEPSGSKKIEDPTGSTNKKVSYYFMDKSGREIFITPCIKQDGKESCIHYMDATGKEQELREYRIDVKSKKDGGEVHSYEVLSKILLQAMNKEKKSPPEEEYTNVVLEQLLSDQNLKTSTETENGYLGKIVGIKEETGNSLVIMRSEEEQVACNRYAAVKKIQEEKRKGLPEERT